jgi:SulP family sulfate permease
VAGLLPARSDYTAVPRSWRSDLVAGLTVGVVALPLALGFGITSGLGAQAGLVTAIVAGVVAAVFGGSNVQVSGPTGAMTVVLVPVVARFGANGVIVVGLLVAWCWSSPRWPASGASSRTSRGPWSRGSRSASR